MAYRYTNTDKWNDAWFASLKPVQKLLFNYLCDNCDIAGFIEIIPNKWAVEIGLSASSIQGALKGLQRGLTYSTSGDCIFINNFLKHQKNLPLNENNKAHIGIIKRFNLYSHKFDIEDINDFIKGASKGLSSPTGNGIGNGIGNEGGTGGNKTEDSKRFTKPSLEEIKSYCTERKNNVDANKFFNFYESKAWMVGSNKMKNWKAAVRTWEQKSGDKNSNSINSIW